MMSENNEINFAGKDDLLNNIFARHRFGIKPGLERTLELLKFCGDPHKDLKTIHIAGTNGKGSVNAMISSILMEAGYKTGSYTSPHLIEFNERIKINGNKIADNDIMRIAEMLLPKADEIGATFFEITTVMAFFYFAEKRIDIGVIETGMGGRYDSTNVLEPLVAVITNIGMDHQKFLGDTIEKIAFEKAGIIKQNYPVVIGNVETKLNKIFQERSEKVKFIENEYFSEMDINERLKPYGSLNVFGKQFNNIKIDIPGIKQAENAALSIAALMESELNVADKIIISGLERVSKNTGFSSRMELIENDPPLIIDVAHNIDSVKSLKETLLASTLKEHDWQVMFGVMADKDIYEMLEIMKDISGDFIFTSPRVERASKYEQIGKIAKELKINNINIPQSEKAFQHLTEQNKPSVIAGSFYLIGEVLEYIKSEKPDGLE